jgi:hypothetical protein
MRLSGLVGRRVLRWQRRPSGCDPFPALQQAFRGGTYAVYPARWLVRKTARRIVRRDIQMRPFDDIRPFVIGAILVFFGIIRAGWTIIAAIELYAGN